MKKWLDDLYAILLKRGFITLDNVLKKYKTEIEEYEEIKVNNELIRLNPNESITFNLSNYFNKYDRFIIFNRGHTGQTSFIRTYYKYADNAITKFNEYNNIPNFSAISNDNQTITLQNLSDTVYELDIYVKKFC